MKLREMATCGVVHCFQIHPGIGELMNIGNVTRLMGIFDQGMAAGRKNCGGNPMENGEFRRT